MDMSKKPTVLMILDGYGLNDTTKGNAVAEGKTPVMDKLMAEYPFVKGNASGMAVGLPEGQMGNSEVGHLNMGAGRIIYQELTKITKAIEDGDFFENQALLAACKNAKENNTALHMMGLVSDGGVHSHNGHIYGLLELAKRQGVEKVYVHCFLDGRDTPPASGKEYVEIVKDGAPVATVKDGDSVIFFNFRPDRAREITRTFCDDNFEGFDRGERVKTTFVCFTEYDVTIQNKQVAFVKEEITNTFGEFLAAHNMTQARIAETEKYAHVTFFFNGGVEEPNKGEDRILVKSPKVATYDLKPEMSAYEVCDKLVDAIKSDKYDVIIINFANPDMVGHTGVEDAAIKAIEAVDECVGKAVDALKEVDGQMFICADHGNAEQLIDETTGEPFTAHTTNPVPFILVNADPAYKLREGGCLADIAPTLIELMGMEQPKEMTGKSLLVK